ncbi:MAG TPA: DUF2071 domain-containing protein [Acidimicrobiales bacterium]|nr:DUF2071 domain-containing protein [Acidimicrobiales bacterium]
MLTTEVDCTIARRLLVNYRVNPEMVANLLPAPFRPQIVSGWAVGGVCFIALESLRPAGTPSALGFSSENVAHRFAVEWDDDDGHHLGVYVPRRDTGSRMISLSGGRVFPGRHGLAHFYVNDSGKDLHIEVVSRDHSVRLVVTANQAKAMTGELFRSIDDATSFFKMAPVGYSPAQGQQSFDGVRLLSECWDAEPASLSEMKSSVFDDETLFPRGTCSLDSALIMRNLSVRWATQGRLRSHSMASAC